MNKHSSVGGRGTTINIWLDMYLTVCNLIYQREQTKRKFSLILNQDQKKWN